MGQIKAIETIYNGYRFRSRLEARWAVFFDTLGIKYEYEPQGFDLGGVAGRYLPDFWLLDQETWFEVKGTRVDEGSPESIKAVELAYQSGQSVFVACGSTFSPWVFDGEDYVGQTIWEFTPDHRGYGDYEGDYGAQWLWCVFQNKPIVTREVWCCFGDEYCRKELGMVLRNDPIDRAYIAARQARFEHGETPR